jgi:hypothetical protein
MVSNRTINSAVKPSGGQLAGKGNMLLNTKIFCENGYEAALPALTWPRVRLANTLRGLVSCLPHLFFVCTFIASKIVCLC